MFCASFIEVEMDCFYDETGVGNGFFNDFTRQIYLFFIVVLDIVKMHAFA